MLNECNVKVVVVLSEDYRLHHNAVEETQQCLFERERECLCS